MLREEKTGLLELEINDILLCAKRFNCIEKIILFGSRAKGNYKQGSDVDLAVFGSKVGYCVINEFSYLLNEESSLPYFFDVINLSSIQSKALLFHIEKYGLRLK